MNKERIKQYNRKYYLENREKISQRRKAKYRLNRDHYRKYIVLGKCYYYLRKLQKPPTDAKYTLEHLAHETGRSYSHLCVVANKYFPKEDGKGRVRYTRNQIKLIKFLYSYSKLPYPVFENVLKRFWNSEYNKKEVAKYVQEIRKQGILLNGDNSKYGELREFEISNRDGEIL